ncbi:pinin/SDK/memA/ protein conserved region-domain-containing protein [Thamnidium elegans]|nr:pinin/SDK/memA/ protein conserved region-domain-containing protein [Thamnidium elegans]
MVQSSIVVPSNNARKRSLDSTNKTDSDATPDEEIKRPRLELNEAGKNRNRRLFGALLGTLNKFKDETEKTSEIDKNRREINEKLHDKLEQERKELAEKLRARREEKDRKLEHEKKIIREKLELFNIHQQEKLANFLKTKTEPSIYYLPEKLTDEMVLTIEKQKEKVQQRKIELENRNDIASDPLPKNEEDSAIINDEEN